MKHVCVEGTPHVGWESCLLLACESAPSVISTTHHNSVSCRSWIVLSLLSILDNNRLTLYYSISIRICHFKLLPSYRIAQIIQHLCTPPLAHPIPSQSHCSPYRPRLSSSYQLANQPFQEVLPNRPHLNPIRSTTYIFISGNRYLGETPPLLVRKTFLDRIFGTHNRMN